MYEDAEAIYAEVKRDGELLVEEAFSVLIPNSVVLAYTSNYIQAVIRVLQNYSLQYDAFPGPSMGDC